MSQAHPLPATGTRRPLGGGGSLREISRGVVDLSLACPKTPGGKTGGIRPFGGSARRGASRAATFELILTAGDRKRAGMMARLADDRLARAALDGWP